MMPDEFLPYLANKIGFKKDSLGELIFVLLIGLTIWGLTAYYFIKDYI